MANQNVPISHHRGLKQKFIDNGDGTYSAQVITSSTGGGTTDTELPAAAVLADAAANPTAPAVGAHNLSWNGTTWDRLRGASGDTLTNTGVLAEGGMRWNTGSWDRMRNNVEGSLFATAARTATPTAANLTNFNGRAILVILDVTAITATPLLTLTISGVDIVSGKVYALLTSAVIGAVSTTVFKVGPGLTAAANLVANEYLPRALQFSVSHGDADSATYSVGYSLVCA
ncbi:MAG: hypothetical protein H0X07_06310 [Gemmatimonadales bacterium]|nr:hypothetical protein [Gemmatimonadales bacterium]